MSTVLVSEIFCSIQGESTFAGAPCTFVRTAGCNLRCGYCDTKYAYEGGREMEMSEILREVGACGQRLVEVTGGEPLHQRGVPELIAALADAGYQVLVETNGSYNIGVVDERAIRVMDVKCPRSGMSDRVDWANVGRLRPCDQVKFVLCDRADYDWAKGKTLELELAAKATVLFSPAHGVLRPQELARWILQDKLPVRLQLQLHKYIWGERTRGV